MTINIPFDIQIIKQDKAVKDMILEMVRVLNKLLPKVAKNVERRLRDNLGEFFYRSEEYQEIISTGRGEFGFPEGSEKSRLRNIIDALQDTVRVRFRKVNKRASGGKGLKLVGGLDVVAFPNDFNYILSLPEATVKVSEDDDIFWLFYMLTLGNTVVISDYNVEFRQGKGRSGIAHMVKKSGGAWRVPPKLAGTLDDNWITRSVVKFQSFITNRIQTEIENEFSIIRII